MSTREPLDLSYVVYRGGAGALARLPLRPCRSLAEAVAYGASFVLRRERAVVEANLRRVVGDVPAPELRGLARRAFAAYGGYWSDVAHLERIDPAHLDELFTPGGLDDFRAQVGGGAAIFALPHLGCWEMAGLWAVRNGIAITTVAEPAASPRLTAWFEERRSALGLRVLTLGRQTATELLATLDGGGAVALVADRDVVGDGIDVEFFGEPTKLPAGPAMLAIRSGAPLYPTAAFLAPDGRYQTVIRPPVDTARSGRLRDDVTRVTAALAREFERLIAAVPAQWHVFQPNWAAPHAAAPDRPARRSVVRIALVSPYSFDLPGGVQGQVIGLARAFAAQGDAVTVIGPGTDIAAITLPPEVTVSLVGPSVSIPVNGSRAPVALSRAAARATMSALRGWGPDVIHLHEPLVPVTSLWPLRAHLAPTVGTFHRAGATALYRLVRPAASHLAARLDRGAVVSEAARATASDVVGPQARDYVLLPNGVDVERFSSAAPWPVEAPTVLFIGRHEERKGLGVLLAAVAELPGDLRVWVVGAGPETARLRARYDDPRIAWLGRVTDDEVASRLAGAQVFVAPSLGGESFGVVLLEAMAAGVRVICSDLDGYRLAAADVATYVPPGDPTALTAALQAALLAERHQPHLVNDGPDADAARRAVARGRTRAAEFSFASLTASYRVLYDEVLDEEPEHA